MQRDPASATDLDERIRDRLDTLSKAHRAIAEYLLSEPAEGAFLPAIAVAERTGASESTVVRLAHKLGYGGYPQLQQELQQRIRQRLTPSAMFQSPSLGTNETLYDRVFAFERQNLERTRATVSDEQLQRAVDLIANARHTFVIGLRSSFATAYLVASLLDDILGRATLLSPAAGLLPDQLARLQPSDVVLGIGFPRYARLTAHTLAFAKSAGARIIAITDRPLSPLGQHADLVLVAAAQSLGFAQSGAGALAIVNAIVAGVSFAQRDATLARVRRLDEIHRHFHTHIVPAYDDERNGGSLWRPGEDRSP